MGRHHDNFTHPLCLKSKHGGFGFKSNKHFSHKSFSPSGAWIIDMLNNSWRNGLEDTLFPSQLQDMLR